MMRPRTPPPRRKVVLLPLAVALLLASGPADARDLNDLPVVYVRFGIATRNLDPFRSASTVDGVSAALTQLLARKLPYWRFETARNEDDFPNVDIEVESLPRRAEYWLSIVAHAANHDAKAMRTRWLDPGEEVPRDAEWPAEIGAALKRWMSTQRLELADSLATVAPLGNDVDPLEGPRGALPFARAKFPCLCTATFRIDYEVRKEGTTINVHSQGTLRDEGPEDPRVVVRHIEWKAFDNAMWKAVDDHHPGDFRRDLRPLNVYLEPGDGLPDRCDAPGRPDRGLPAAGAIRDE